MPLTKDEKAKNFRVAAYSGNLNNAQKYFDVESVNSMGKDSGKTALHFAAQAGHVEMIGWLLKNNANINSQDKDQNTPLMLALLKQQNGAAATLLQEHCQAVITNSSGLNGLQIAITQGAPPELIQTLRNKIISEIGSDAHLTKQGYVQYLNDTDLEHIQATLKRTKRPHLLPIIVSVQKNSSYWYEFFNDQLPHLHRLGYRVLGVEAPFDKSLICSPKDQEKYTWHEVGFNAEQRQNTSYVQTLPTLLKTQLAQHITDYDGGIIYVLNSSAVDLQRLRRKLMNTPVHIQTLGDIDDITKQLERLSLQETSIRTTESLFWQPIESYLSQNKSKSYKEGAAPFAIHGLKRIHPDFSVVKDPQGGVHGLVRIDSLQQFNEISETIERKLGITPIVEMVAHQMTLRVPYIESTQKIITDAAFTVGFNESMELSVLFSQWYSLPKTKLAPANLNVTKLSLSMPSNEPPLVVEQGFVKKIDLLEFGKTDMILGMRRFEYTTTILDLTLLDGSHLVHAVAQDSSQKRILTGKLKLILIKKGAHQDASQEQRQDRELFSWEQTLCTNYYKSTAIKFYQNLRQLLPNLILKQKAHMDNGVEIFSFGCGNGEELETLHDHLSNKIRIVSMYGFDINAANFPDSMPGVTFKQGNVHQLDNLMQDIPVQHNTFKIGLFIGLLVSTCMKGTYQALSILQQARMMDQIIISGATDVLLNKVYIKATGFNVQESDFTIDLQRFKKPIEELDTLDWTSKKVFELTPMSKEDRKHYLVKRAKERSSNHAFDCLDLSMSANPLGDLTLFSMHTLMSIKQVDISWSYLKPQEIKPFFERLAALGKPLHILLSTSQIHAATIVEIGNQYPSFTLVERLDEPLKDEVPFCTPPQAKRIGLYEKLPNRSLRK